MHAEPTLMTGEPVSLRHFFATYLTSRVLLTSGIWMLYLQHRGYSLGEIGLAESAFHLAPLTLELPTGGLSDAWGRKWSIAMGGVFVALSAILLLSATSLPVVMLGMYLSGAAYTSWSGAEQAYLYDALAERRAEGRFSHLFGRLLSVAYVVSALSIWVGGALADVSFTIPFLAEAAVALVAVTLAVTMREPSRRRASHRSVRRMIAEAIGLLRTRHRLLGMLVFTQVLWVAVAFYGLYGQAVMRDAGLSTSRIGFVLGVSLLATAVGGWISGAMHARGSLRAWTPGAVVMTIVAGLAMGSGIPLVIVVVLLITEFLIGIYEPIVTHELNAGASSEQRATVLSVGGWMFSAGMIWAFPLAGWVAERWSWLAMFAGTGAVLAVAFVAWWVLDARWAREATAGGAAGVG
jgi:MFS family permease